MEITKYDLWDQPPGTTNTKPYLLHYRPDKAITKSALLIFPGSGYRVSPSKAPQEGDRVARYFCDKGINTFVLEYRVYPDGYPLPLLDGRRAIRFLRYNSNRFGITKNRIATMGFSAGGHLTASLCAYREALAFENLDPIDQECFIPDLQILCYPVINIDKTVYFSHAGSALGLQVENNPALLSQLCLENTSADAIPPTFIWHNFDDTWVSVVNSLKYAETLRSKGTSVEMHIYPDGNHGIGLPVEDRKDFNHNRFWIKLLENWFSYNDFF